jgi:hypothetical protein
MHCSQQITISLYTKKDKMDKKMPIRSLLWNLLKQIKRFWAFLLLLASGLITKWVFDSLETPQALIALLSTKLSSLGTILLTATVLFIILLFYYRRLEDEKLLIQRKAEQDLEAEKLRIQRKVEKDLQEEKLRIQRKAEKDLEEDMLSTQRKIEKALSDFIYDIFESDLDDELKKIVEDSPIASGSNGGPLYILEGLIDYFDFRVAAISLHQPDEFGNYLLPVASVPPAIIDEKVKGNLTFYIGNDHSRFDSIGLAGYSYKNKELVKIYLNHEHHAFKVYENELNQLIEEPFPAYRHIGIHEVLSIRSIAAVPLFRNHKDKADLLGVLCVDASEEETFKSQKHDDKLIKAARCVAISVDIQNLLHKLH